MSSTEHVRHGVRGGRVAAAAQRAESDAAHTRRQAGAHRAVLPYP